MTIRRGVSLRGVIGCTFVFAAGCSSGGSTANSNGGANGNASGGIASGGIASGGIASGGIASGGTASGGAQTAGSGDRPTGGTSAGGRSGGTGGTATAAGGQSASSGGQGGHKAAGGGTGTAGAAGSSPCIGKAWSTADPTVAGPFAITADKNVGPLAGALPDPIYGDTQQRFNVYRPKDLTTGYCHPILVWANGHGDNPEQNPPKCVVNSSTNSWCGTYPVLINQLASHGFVVVASLSTTTSQGNPLPTIVGLNWLLQQAEDSTSPYYHHLDTAHIGALGHSEGGLSTCKAASDPRISVIATVSGTSTISSLHGPALFFCGEKDTVVSCDSVKNTFASVKDQPAMFINNLTADHGGWEYQSGAKGPDIFGLTAWFRAHLMGDTENRKRFYGSSCTFCSDNRVKVEQNSLMNQ